MNSMSMLNVDAVAHAWSTIMDNVGLLRVPTNDAECSSLVSTLDSLLDATRDTVEHGLGDLIDLVGGLIEAYEARLLDDSGSSPADVLRLLMDSNGLRQTDLAAEVGGQSVVSDILNGRRQINAKQAARLAVRFGVSAAVFVAKPEAPQARAASHERAATLAAPEGRIMNFAGSRDSGPAITRIAGPI